MKVLRGYGQARGWRGLRQVYDWRGFGQAEASKHPRMPSAGVWAARSRPARTVWAAKIPGRTDGRQDLTV